MSISERRRADIRKELKRGLKILNTEMDNIENMQEKGVCIRDQQLRFLEHYPGIRMEYEGLVAQSLKDEEAKIPEGALKIFVEMAWKHKDIGTLEQITEAAGYYRCDKCRELHVISRECMYTEYEKYNEDKDTEEEQEEVKQ